MSKPQTIDMSLCVSEVCKNKCKRHKDFWTPNQYYQSYINPPIEYDKKGIQKPCKSRMGE